MDKSKNWFTSYTGVGRFTLLSASDRLALFEDAYADEDRGEQIQDLEQMFSHRTLKDAVKELLASINCDLDDLRMAKRDLAAEAKKHRKPRRRRIKI